MAEQKRIPKLAKRLQMAETEMRAKPQSPRPAPRVRPPGPAEREFAGNNATPGETLRFTPPAPPPPRNEVARGIAAQAAAKQMLFDENRMPDRIGQRPAPLASVMAMSRAGVPVGTPEYWKWNYKRQFPMTFFGDKGVSGVPQA